MKKPLGNWFNKILGSKVGNRLFFIYLLGGLFPMAMICFYLINGTNQLLVKHAETTEITELEAVKSQVQEMMNTMTTLSQYFYFDEELEEIAQKEYVGYQEMVDDFKNYDGFYERRKYYNGVITRISLFLQNDTIKGNSNFVLVDEEIEKEAWYERVTGRGNGVVWTYLPISIDGYDYALALTRNIKTKKGADVGVLAIYIRPERMEKFIWERKGTTFILLNGEILLTKAGKDIPLAEVQEFLPDQEEEEWQQRVTIGDEAYLVTCENVLQKDTKDYLQIVSVRAMHEILQEARKQNIQSLSLLGISAVIAVSMIMVYSWHFGNRVAHFKAQMKKASEGNFALEAKLGGNDEISQLYDYLGAMIYDIQRLLAEVYQEKIQAERLKTSQKDAEFRMLTSQINPHFLYNTLETIRMKARVNGQPEIEELVKMLARILRSSIQAGEKEMTVGAEVELVECYLKIQQYRFGERIWYEIQIEEGLKTYQILPLLLQPIVENSIIHGLENAANVGHIWIRVYRQDFDICICVEDDGTGIDTEKLREIQEVLRQRRIKGEHIGICNVHQRVRMKYGEPYGVSVESVAGKGTRVTIRLPGPKREEE